jgi:dTMP kinase
MKKIGMFVTVEGPDGAGKTTALTSIKEGYEALGYSVYMTREPGGTLNGERLREIVINPTPGDPVDAIAEFLIMSASRHIHTKNFVIPKLKEGHIVLSSRYFDSSRVLQGLVRGIGEYVHEFSKLEGNKYLGVRPDVTFFLNASSSVCLQRVTSRKEALDKLDVDFTNPELNIGKIWESYFKIVSNHPCVAMGSKKIKTIDAEQSIANVRLDILDAVHSTVATFVDRPSLHRSFLEEAVLYI